MKVEAEVGVLHLDANEHLESVEGGGCKEGFSFGALRGSTAS